MHKFWDPNFSSGVPFRGSCNAMYAVMAKKLIAGRDTIIQAAVGQGV